MEIVTILLFLALLLWLRWRWEVMSIFQKIGIPGPRPNIFCGNLLELYWKEPIRCHTEWKQKYGKVLGYFEGITPVLLITDPELLRNIFIKDFNKFMDREHFIPLREYSTSNKIEQSILFFPAVKWKPARKMLTPTFTTAKVKQISGSIYSSIDCMIKSLEKFINNNEEFNIFDVYQRFSLDVISKTAFGVRTDVQTNLKSRYFKAANLIMDCPYRNPLYFIGQSIPILRRPCILILIFWLILKFNVRNPHEYLFKYIREVLQYRRKNPQAKNSDFLQLLIDNEVTESDERDDSTRKNSGNESQYFQQDKKTRKMTDNEIISNSITVLLAGYETTSTALSFLTYFLAKHQDIQQQLFNELDAAQSEGGKLDLSVINRLEYLDKILSESFRMMPTAYLFTNRYASCDVQYEEIKIPKGMLIKAPNYLIHHDPEFWENPEEFDPERFSKKSKSNGVTYLPFGVGPRNCIGMRFAQIEIKLVIAYIIYHFEVHLADIHKESFSVSQMARILKPSAGVFVRLQKRT